jgi:hypothetical protein
MQLPSFIEIYPRSLHSGVAEPGLMSTYFTYTQLSTESEIKVRKGIFLGWRAAKITHK